MKLPCAFCGLDVDDAKPGSFIEVTGWAEVRAGGGAHAIAMRRNLGRAAHGQCIEIQKRGGEQLGLGAVVRHER